MTCDKNEFSFYRWCKKPRCCWFRGRWGRLRWGRWATVAQRGRAGWGWRGKGGRRCPPRRPAEWPPPPGIFSWAVSEPQATPPPPPPANCSSPPIATRLKFNQIVTFFEGKKRGNFKPASFPGTIDPEWKSSCLGGFWLEGLVTRVRRGGAGSLYHLKSGFASKNASLY